MSGLFRLGSFVGHGGQPLVWKIDCDALSESDWETLAWLAADRLPVFDAVVGVPRGGLRFAEWLKPHARSHTVSDALHPMRLLIVDDVLTTGGSMEEARREHGGGFDDVVGCVVFARGLCPEWVTPVFRLTDV